MNLQLLEEFACPGCRRESCFCVNATSGVRGSELLCGFLKCSGCGCSYPVIDGVAVLTQDWEQYIFKYRTYLERSVAASTVPEELKDWFRFAEPVAHVEVAEEVLPYVFNHLCFSGSAFAGNPVDEVRSPKLTSLIASSAASGPYQIVRREVVRGSLKRHLDIGCSVGTAVAISAKAGTHVSVGIDISFAAVHAGRALIGASTRQGQGVAELVVGDAKCLPVRSGAWSLVTALNVVDEVEVPTDVVRELSRALAPDGQLVVAAPFREDKIEVMGGNSGLVQVSSELDLPWVILRGPRYLEFLSVDAYFYCWPAAGQRLYS